MPVTQTRTRKRTTKAAPGTTATGELDSAVRRYLRFLGDPASLRDEAEIRRRREEVESATDPLVKLRALAALERAEAIDDSAVRAGFVGSAKAWAAANDVPASAFRQFGVPNDVLAEAGLAASGRKERGTGRAPATRRRAPRTSPDTLRDHILGVSGRFTLRDVMEDAGGSTQTVKKVVDQLITAGAVERIGPLEGYAGRGRAPIVYARKG